MIYTWWAQRQASASLQASEALYAGIFNHSAESIFLLDVLPDGFLVWETANAAWEEGMGIPAAAIAGKSLLEVLPSSMAASLENRCRACIAGGGPIVYEQTLELRGSTRMWRVILVPIWDAGGRIVKLQGSARDVTEEKGRSRSNCAKPATATCSPRASSKSAPPWISKISFPPLC
ncbi:PAS domain-containing protein [[Phormidium] sp. ETS-05]|uniref:PAS domain-containing protein n=1 Tax=[Phormidium] sp. ETS-05 TaxID=222819 RepID=UPI0018EED0B4|nr:PAS domain-containing protein [[Phormidium] sp. ETS-05]